ncbi:pentatricopeptide repeat-containing protein At2g13420, mitochondrial-like [Wolffia australiana]
MKSTIPFLLLRLPRSPSSKRFLCTVSSSLDDGHGQPSPTYLGRLLRSCPEADAISSLLIRHHNPFHPMESSLELSGAVSLSPSLVLQVLLRLRHVSKVAISFFLWARDHALHTHDADAYDLMVDTLGKVRQFDVAWQMIMEMDQRGIPPSPRTFLVLVRRLAAAGLSKQALRAFDDMEAFVGRSPTSAEFNLLLDTLCKYGFVKLAADIFNKRKSTHLPSEKTYAILMDGWCKINRPAMAEKFLRETREPNVVCYNILLNGVCRKSSLHPEARFLKTINAAGQLFDEMRSRGIEPDVTSYSILLHVYSRAHKPELCFSLFNSMREKGISPTVATYTSLVKCLASCGRVDDAEKVLDEMLSLGVQPSAATYNCFFKEYRGRKDTASALKLYRIMKERADIHSYNILVGMFSRLDRPELVRELWEDMAERGVGPDVDSYTCMIHELCRKQQWKEACQFFMQMIEKGFLPQKITFETLYRGLIQADMVRTWRRLKKKVEEESLKFKSEFQNYYFKPYKR